MTPRPGWHAPHDYGDRDDCPACDKVTDLARRGLIDLNSARAHVPGVHRFLVSRYQYDRKNHP